METVNVVMLPTEKASDIVKHVNGTLYPFRENKIRLYEKDCTYQYLYFTSDEEIKEPCWVYNESIGIWYCSGMYHLIASGNYKIIATNNPELWTSKAFDPKYGEKDVRGVPKIPLSFVEAYVKAQGKIDEVRLEYWDNNENAVPYQEGDTLNLRLRVDGSVIVHPYKPTGVVDTIYKGKRIVFENLTPQQVEALSEMFGIYITSSKRGNTQEEMYTREDLINACYAFFTRCMLAKETQEPFDARKWFDNNY